MEAFPIALDKISPKSAAHTVHPGLGDLFETLLGDAAQRLDARLRGQFAQDPFRTTLNSGLESDNEFGLDFVDNNARSRADADRMVRDHDARSEPLAQNDDTEPPDRSDDLAEVNSPDDDMAFDDTYDDQPAEAQPVPASESRTPGNSNPIAGSRDLATAASTPATTGKAQLANSASPATTAQAVPNGGGVRVQVTPAPLVAHPNAALGGGATVAAMAAETAQAASQGLAANPLAETAALPKTRPGTRPGQFVTTLTGQTGSGESPASALPAQGPNAGLVANSKLAMGEVLPTAGAQSTTGPLTAANAQTLDSQAMTGERPETGNAAAQGQTARALEATSGNPNAQPPQGITNDLTTNANASAKQIKVMSAATAGQKTDGGGQGTNSTSGASLFNLTQPSAHTPQGLSGQARPTASPPVPLEQVAVQIQRAAAAGQDRIRIRLHPSELGQIDVKLKVAADGVVRAVVSVERPETLELLQRDSRGLERALQDAGLKTESGSLSFNLRGETQHGRHDDRHPFDLDNREPEPEPEIAPEIAPEILAAAQAGSGHNLDIRV